MVVVRVVFWTWFAISMVALTWRLIRRVQARRKRRLATSRVGVVPANEQASRQPAQGSGTSGSGSGSAAAAPSVPAAGAGASAGAGAGAGSSGSDGERASPATADAPTTEPQPSEPNPRPTSAEPADSEAPAGPAPEPASSPSAPEPSVGAAARARAGERTVAGMVQGIRMPADLVPQPDAQPRPGTIESVAFVTDGHAPDAVGEAVGAELQRLGFRTHVLADGEVLAVRGDDELKVAVHPRPQSVAYGGLPAFPSAKSGSVVVELWRD